MIRQDFLNRGAKCIASAALLGSLCLASLPANAQQIVARVNGSPITSVDLAQRMRLLQLSGGGKTASRQQAIDELVDQELKLQTAQRYRIEVTEAELNQALGSMASRVNADMASFSRQLENTGISVAALKRKIRADMAWNQIVRGKFQATLQIRDRDVAEAVRGTGGEKVAYNFTLRPIVFIVQRTNGSANYETRMREVEALRARFQNCDEGLRLARGMRDTAVREPITRSSGDISGKQREILEATPVGKLTPPDMTAAGIEVFAVCAKDQTKGSGGAERDVREKMFGDKVTQQGQTYLRELKRAAAIELK